jgi:hypothetical protein
MSPSVPLAELRRALLAGRNNDGGWGYYPGKASRLEPTCWCLLALRDQDAGALEAWPVDGELLRERRDGEPNYGFHGVALLTLLARNIAHRSGNSRLLSGLQQVKGTAVEQSKYQRQNNALRGWSWITETFSWAEPTAWCLLALKKWSKVPGASIDSRRVDEAEALLLDRCAITGGWNYGNSNMMGKELKAYVPTTAVALLSLQNRQSEAAVKRSIEYLERAATTEPSGVALSLAILALGALGRDVSAAREALVAQLPTTLALKNHVATALAMVALGTDHVEPAVVL